MKPKERNKLLKYLNEKRTYDFCYRNHKTDVIGPIKTLDLVSVITLAAMTLFSMEILDKRSCKKYNGYTKIKNQFACTPRWETLSEMTASNEIELLVWSELRIYIT